jgi:hypothetical protein
MLNNGSAGTADEKSPWTQPGFIAAAAVVAIIVVLGLAIAITGGSDSASPSDAPAGSAPPAVSPSAGDSDSVCGLDPGSQAIPTEAPKANWKLRGNVAVPTAPSTYGPGKVEDGVPTCFAHSPTGALFAMLNIQAAMGDFAKQPGRYPIRKVLRMLAAGPGRDVLKDAAARAPVATKGDTTPGAQVAGFSIVRYERDTVVIDVAFVGSRPEASGYVHGQSTMRWERRDWKLVLTQSGAPFDAVQPIADLTGYVPWSGI